MLIMSIQMINNLITIIQTKI